MDTHAHLLRSRRLVDRDCTLACCMDAKPKLKQIKENTMATLREEEMFPILSSAWVEGISVELVSKPGIGKTAVVGQWCQYMANRIGKPFGLTVAHASCDDPSEVAGLPILDTLEWGGEKRATASRSYPGCFPRPRTSLDNGGQTNQVMFPMNEKGEPQVPDYWVWGTSIPKYGVVFVDEFRQATHDTQKVYARLIDERTLGNFSLDELGRWGVVLASNSAKHRSGAFKELAFVKNRKCTIEVEYDYQAHIAHMEKTGQHPMVMAYVDAFPGEVSQDIPSEDVAFCSPRQLLRAAKLLERMGDKKTRTLAMTPAATEVVAGFIGEAAAASFMGFLRRASEMPKYEDIARNPMGCKVPDRPDVNYAVVRMLSERAQVGDAEAIFQYIDRVPTEFRAVLARELIAKNQALASTKPVVEWAQANTDLIAGTASSL